MSVSNSDTTTEKELRLTPNILLRWRKTKDIHSKPGIYSLLLEHSDPNNQVSCLLGDYPDKKDRLKIILADIREVADVLEIKIPARLSLQALKA